MTLCFTAARKGDSGHKLPPFFRALWSLSFFSRVFAVVFFCTLFKPHGFLLLIAASGAMAACFLVFTLFRNRDNASAGTNRYRFDIQGWLKARREDNPSNVRWAIIAILSPFIITTIFAVLTIAFLLGPPLRCFRSENTKNRNLTYLLIFWNVINLSLIHI
eukprot:TRINITY_DN14008_c0_g1_i1.p1 TRINITY_DN14008_c0_g1~~TRINITY_DN14008_c0_g1_i1.p1  ORF type:complete len:161 (-),score=13.09 TRINITY_DN14008_c0_g1_i1:59-541(-)